ncbi:Zinc knuckle [Fragilaria crotonensis]|nr:Zinc knuckle [Fragilaria crotonensis]
MTEAEDVTPRVDENERKRKLSTPPDGYTCNLCGIPGHWIQQCETRDKKTKGTKKRRNTDREFIAGIEPSPEDIAQAREMQLIQPPLCYCGKQSRIKKVKQSRVSRDSRAIGNYFFFCAERREDHPKCRFARPAEEQLKLLSTTTATTADSQPKK